MINKTDAETDDSEKNIVSQVISFFLINVTKTFYNGRLSQQIC